MAIAWRFTAKSDLGLGPKSRNEDSGYAGPHLLVLADGMGGHAAGDVASSMIVGELAPLDGDGVSGETALRVLADRIRRANERLAASMAENPEQAGMGSTTIAILRSGNKLAMAHIGDSRGYLVRDGQVTQITRDHSFVQQLIDDGRITPDEAMGHPQRSIVTRVMTGDPGDEPDLSLREARIGDRYLLCSDGLSDYVTTEVIGEILADSPGPEVAADRLVQVALKAATRDNVTVVIADVVDASSTPSTSPIVVGAAARRMRGVEPEPPTSPAAKAAALSRAASGIPDEEEGPELADEEASGSRGRWIRRGLVAGLLAALVVGGAAAGYAWTQRQLFIGADNGNVALFKGVPQDLGPISLSSPTQQADIALDNLPGNMRTSVENGIEVRNRADAEAKLGDLRAKALWCVATYGAHSGCGTGSTPSPTDAPTDGPTDEPTGPTAPATPTLPALKLPAPPSGHASAQTGAGPHIPAITLPPLVPPQHAGASPKPGGNPG